MSYAFFGLGQENNCSPGHVQSVWGDCIQCPPGTVYQPDEDTDPLSDPPCWVTSGPLACRPDQVWSEQDEACLCPGTSIDDGFKCVSFDTTTIPDPTFTPSNQRLPAPAPVPAPPVFVPAPPPPGPAVSTASTAGDNSMTTALVLGGVAIAAVLLLTSGSKRAAANPKRPPKSWWRRCVAGVSKSGGAYDPASVCGSLWNQKMSPSQRRAAVRRSER